MLSRFILLTLTVGALGACSVFEQTGEAHTSVRSVPDLTVDRSNEARAQRRMYASLRTDVAPDFTGCVENSDECYVIGEYVDARLRFEPQTGRFWFLDPESGNTYFADGELRTGDHSRVKRELVLREGIYPEGDISLNVPDEDEAEGEGADSSDEEAELADEER